MFKIEIATNPDRLIYSGPIEQDKEVYLYGVLVESPFISRKIFVLAESKENAINQALCVIYDDKEEEEKAKCTVEKLPLAIRGWGRTIF